MTQDPVALAKKVMLFCEDSHLRVATGEAIADPGERYLILTLDDAYRAARAVVEQDKAKAPA